jgi:hypothetical protein
MKVAFLGDVRGKLRQMPLPDDAPLSPPKEGA